MKNKHNLNSYLKEAGRLAKELSKEYDNLLETELITYLLWRSASYDTDKETNKG